ncbi:unnamed protein product [Sphenostylis stenocarpa]|uniref:Uncharacterized protein n=1 Tax=Sphenostylis stenocarpa TaxID=92480 RepID=A0AA86TDV7_9FABA|nr:unnamed protein product [Sphenostylis stenocarpa]
MGATCVDPASLGSHTVSTLKQPTSMNHRDRCNHPIIYMFTTTMSVPSLYTRSSFVAFVVSALSVRNLGVNETQLGLLGGYVGRLWNIKMLLLSMYVLD